MKFQRTIPPERAKNFYGALFGWKIEPLPGDGYRHIDTGCGDDTPDGGPAGAAFAAMSGTDVATYHRDKPGMGASALEDGVVYHTYSAYARGLDGLWGMYPWLDRAPRGRNETGIWCRRHDEYDKR